MRSLLAALLLCLAGGIQTQAQHNHSHGHHEYQNWSSQKIANCCDNRDCAGVDDKDIRQTAAGTEIKIADQWCPVLREHYLTRGKSPDWAVNHACIGNNDYWLSKPPCERLLCFTPSGGF